MRTKQLKKLTRIFAALSAAFAIVLISFSANALDLKTKKDKATGKEYYYYKVKKGETLQSLSNTLGLAQWEIVQYNPDVLKIIEKGMELKFPVENFNNTQVPDSLPGLLDNRIVGISFNDTIGIIDFKDTIVPVLVNPSMTLTPVHPEVQIKKLDVPTLKVAICLPFLLGEAEPNKTSQYATDFYRGFLIGIDSLRREYRFPPIEITAVDCGTEKTAFSKLLKGENSISGADIIIAPDMQTRLKELGDYGLENKVYIFNTFQPRNTAYQTNPYMLQGNVPTENMYNKVINYFIDNAGDATIVFLENKTKQNKKDFVTALKKSLTDKDIKFNVMSYEKALANTALSTKFTDTKTSYVFVPEDASLDELQKFSAAILDLKTKVDADSVGNVWLLGYPEYVLFRNEAKDDLKKLNTRYYSRFITDNTTPDTKAVSSLFKDYYGTDLPTGAPNQALYGFDVAHWIVALAARGISRDNISATNDEIGAQTTYRFIPVENGGLVNDAVLIVKLSSGEDTKIEVL